MTVPAITKWRPRCIFHRSRFLGWQWFFYQHTDHNPVIVIERWCGSWYFEFYRWRTRRSGHGM